MRLRPATAAALDRGIVLFNERRFFDAHEAWEEAWLEEDGEVRQLLQGLIQVAAGYVQAFQNRRPGGATKLLSAGLAKLGPLGKEVGGLPLADFCRAVDRALDEARRWERGELPGMDGFAAPALERRRADHDHEP